jgi:glutathione S-transferase
MSSIPETYGSGLGYDSADFLTPVFRGNSMDIVHVVIALALLQFFIFGGLVGWARVKSGIDAPTMTGDPIFERYQRVHYNTMEQLVTFIPGMLLFGHYINATAAAGLGIVFIIGRTIYFRAYLADPVKRGPGYGLTMLPTMVLLLGGLGGAFWSAVGAG